MSDWKEEVRKRLAGLKLSPVRENELAEELAQHLQDRFDELIAGGATPDEARRTTLEEWSAKELTEALRRREHVHHEHAVAGAAARSHLIADLWRDLLYGARTLRLNPAFTIIAILSLALGIGANTAIFQLLDSVRLRTLPVQNPQDLAEVRIVYHPHGRSGNFSADHSSLTDPQWEQIRAQQQVFSGDFAWSQATFNIAPGGEARNVEGLYVSGDFFRVLGVPALLGRVITSEDDRRGCGSSAAVLSNAFWQREYGGDPAVVGRKITLDSHPFEIIGVTPAYFFGMEVGKRFDVAVPICADPFIRGEQARVDVRRDWWLTVMGRLKPGITLTQASKQLEAISPGLFEATVPPTFDAQEAKEYREFRLGALPAGTGVSDLRNDYETPLYMLLAIAGFVLLIACANLANLMLARASAREREVAIRLALGASRGRLIRQMLAESMLLAFIGAALGLALSRSLSGLMIAFLSTEQTKVFVELQADWRVFGFTLALAVLTCILFGLAPAVRSTRTAPAEALKTGGRGNTEGRERFGLRRILVATQVALSLVLLVGALLFTRSLRNLLTLNPGFQENGILITNLDLTQLHLPAERRLQFKRDLLERVRSIPGVDAAADTSVVPVSQSWSNDGVWMDQHDSKQKQTCDFSQVSSGYFRTLETPMLAGRDFDETDTANSPKVAIVNEAFAKMFVNGANPLGMRFRVEGDPEKPDHVYQIIGLVRNTKHHDLRDEDLPIAFTPAAQDPRPDEFDTLMIHSSAPLTDIVAGVKRTVGETSPDINLTFTVFKSQIREGLLRERLMATLSGFFGFLAALLAVVGLYGVMSYLVQRRTNEIGIRMALGASRPRIVGMILREALLLLGIGIGAGLALALALGRTATALLFSVKATDPLTIALSIMLLAAVSLAASFLPAQRAARLDPMQALRYE